MGIIASGMLGILFLDFKNSNELIFVEGLSLSILTDKTNYKIGEPVSIRIINSGTVPIMFSDSSLGLKIRGLDTMLIYSPMTDQVLTTLDPREEVTIEWDQIKNDGNPAVQGIYKIYSSGETPDGVNIEKTTNIEIFK